MSYWQRRTIVFSLFFLAIFSVGIFQSWNVAFAIFNICLISAIMALGVNIQVGYAGIFNAGIMGFAAIGGLAAVLVSHPPIKETVSLGGKPLLYCLIIIALTSIFSFLLSRIHFLSKMHKNILIALVILSGFFLLNIIGTPAIEKIESFKPAASGFLGGLGLPIILSWVTGGIAAGLIAWLIGTITLGLRSDYLAIATLGIAESIIYILKNEDWLTRGVKNVNGLPRPVPYEINLQKSAWFVDFCDRYQFPLIETSSIFVKVCYSSLFLLVLIILFSLFEVALKSPWGRMMRAIRDNEVSARAMGKNIKARHIEIFVLGSAIVGLAGAMLTTLEGQFTPIAYQPLRFTFTVWVMVIIGGTGNNYGSIIGGFIVWLLWVEADPIGLYFVQTLTSPLSEANPLKLHLLNNAAHMRYVMMGLLLLLVLRFSPKGIFPEGK
jgi:branched-chain amino acid transport system permease protein